MTRYQSAYEPYVITSKYVPWSVDIQQKVLTLTIQFHAVGVMNVSQAMVRTRLPVCLKCISAAYLFSSCLSISSSTRVINMKSRPGAKRYALFPLVLNLYRQNTFQRKYNRKLYIDFKEETCLRYDAIVLLRLHTSSRYPSEAIYINSTSQGN